MLIDRKNSIVGNLIIKKLEFIENKECKTAKIYDFEDLFSSILHNDLIAICETVYNKQEDLFNCIKAYWLKHAKNFLFENYVCVSNRLRKKVKGIPKGNCFSSEFANLFLHYFEEKYSIVTKFTAFRYINDLIVFNCKNFENSFIDIYATELSPKRTFTRKGKVSYLQRRLVIIFAGGARFSIDRIRPDRRHDRTEMKYLHLIKKKM